MLLLRRFALVIGFVLPAAAATVTGRLELTDLPPSAMPVAAHSIQLLPQARGIAINAQPDRDGYFRFDAAPPGRYSLVLSFPGRITRFASSTGALDPVHIDIGNLAADDWRITVSLRTADFSVAVTGAPGTHGELAAVLCPDDVWLTLRESCHVNTIRADLLGSITGVLTVFRYIPCGRYRLFIVDSRFSSPIAARATRYSNFLGAKAMAVDACGSNVPVTAMYVDSDEVERAVAAYHVNF